MMQWNHPRPSTSLAIVPTTASNWKRISTETCRQIMVMVVVMVMVMVILQLGGWRRDSKVGVGNQGIHVSP